MHKRRQFSTEENQTITEMRSSGIGWHKIASHIGASTTCVISHSVRNLGLSRERVPVGEMAHPLYEHKSMIRLRCRRGVSTEDIVEEINDLDPDADVTENAVLMAIAEWGFERIPLPKGHIIAWGAIIAGTSLEGNSYYHP